MMLHAAEDTGSDLVLSMERFSIVRRSPRLQCGGRQKPRMLRPVRTRELST